jgi:RNA methyltransferase, TrmH family
MRLTKADLEAYRALRRKDGRLAAGEFLVEGWRSVAAAIVAKAPIVSVAVLADHFERPELAPLRKRGVPIATISECDLGRISATEHSQGIVARAKMATTKLAELIKPGDRLLVALDGVGDPGNVGTIIRTADWFAAGGILLGAGCVDPFNEKVVRSTAGSIFHVPLVTDIDLPTALTEAKAVGFAIVTAQMEGTTPLTDWHFAPRSIIVLGSEAHGVSAAVKERADVCVAVPRFGRAESLNVAIAAGILLAHARKGGK